MDIKSKLNIKAVIIFISISQGLQFSISPVLKQIQKSYPYVDVSNIQMLVTMPSLLAAIMALLSGWLVMKFSKKVLLIIACLIAGISGLVPLLHSSFLLLVGSRMVFGIGAGILSALNVTVVADYFRGKERVSAMGLQSASIGAGILLITSIAGVIGLNDFRNAYFIHIIAIIAMVVIWACLPKLVHQKAVKAKKIYLNKKVYLIALMNFVELMFVMSFSTNIAMHLSGDLSGSSSIAGLLIGTFSGVQIIVGLTLSSIVKYMKHNTLFVAMFSFAIGAMILVLFSDNFYMLMIGAVCCGMSQGIFLPQAFNMATNVVKAEAVTMASAAVIVGGHLGQMVSPFILNGISQQIFGHISTTNVYKIGAFVMFTLTFLLYIGSRSLRKKSSIIHN